MARIAIAGFQHETNSFAKGQAGMAEFELADSWPGLLSDAEVIAQTRGLNLPIAGFTAAAQAAGHALAPILWCAAEPSGPVTDAAFDTITERIVDGIAKAQPDALYLDLHGAMITQSHADGEGALLAKLRDRFGPKLPIAVSLDLHANLSPQMAALADFIAIFRTYPHLDMAATGARCLGPLLRATEGYRPARAFRQGSYLIPVHAQCTDHGPMAALYAEAAGLGVELAAGFAPGDTIHTGPALLATAQTQHAADAAADALLAKLSVLEPEFDQPVCDAGTAVAQAMALPQGLPIVLADIEDNAGGGGSSDTTGLLRALLEGGARDAILGVIHDPDAAATAHLAGLGAEVALALGGRSGCTGDKPLEGRFRVAGLSDGTVRYEGEMYAGGTGQIGPSAALEVLHPAADVTVVVSSTRNQCLDRAYFRHLGLRPEDARLIAVKSTVHFRADFAPIAQAIIPVAVPGALSSDLPNLPYQNLRPGLRLGPSGPAFSPKTKKAVE